MEAEALMKLINNFVDETENGFYEMVYDWYYQTVADSFKDVIDESCKIVVFGDEYAMSVHELYNFDRCLANEAWNNHVSQSLEDGFRDWANRVISDDIETFAAEFQRWLAKQDREDSVDAANVAVALMSGEIDLTKIITDWLHDQLS